MTLGRYNVITNDSSPNMEKKEDKEQEWFDHFVLIVFEYRQYENAMHSEIFKNGYKNCAVQQRNPRTFGFKLSWRLCSLGH